MAEVFDGYAVKLAAQLFADEVSLGEDSDILEHSLAAIAKARSLDGENLQSATELVDDESGESFTLNVLSDDNQLGTLTHNLLENRENFADGVNLAVGEEDERFLSDSFHLLCIGNHVGGDVAAVELHTLNNLQIGFHGLGLFNGDDAVVANLAHSLSNEAAGFFVAGGNAGNLSDSIVAFNLYSLLAGLSLNQFRSEFYLDIPDCFLLCFDCCIGFLFCKNCV